MKRVALYVRVSTVEQKKHGLSVDSQLVALHHYCKKNRYIIAGVYNDAGISAHIKYTKRPALLQMLKDCRDKKIDLVIFTKLDRFFRSVKDYYACIEQMADVPWKAIWEDYETETSAGKFKVNIMLSVAQAEADRTSERIKAIFEYKRAEGKYVGTCPLGYKRENKMLVIDEEMRDVIKGFFECYLSSFNIARCRDYLMNYGISRTRKSIRTMLCNKTYKGDAFGTSCEPYISEDEYNIIVKSFQSRSRTSKKSNRIYIFSGLIKCANCGGTLSGHCHRKNNKDYKYYECTNGSQYSCINSKTTSETIIEQKIINIVEDKLNGYNASFTTSEKVISINTNKIERLKLKLNRIGNRYEDGDISYEEYTEKKNAVKNEINELSHIVTKKKKSLPDNWHELYSTFDDAHKRALWMSVFEKITFDNKGNIDLFF